MNFKTFTAQNFNGDEEKSHQHLVNESYYGDYSLTGSRENLQIILDTMTREDSKVFMRYFKETVRRDKERTKNDDGKPNKIMLLFPVFFFLLSIYLFISGCTNILKINDLTENGVEVQVVVTDKDVKDEGENLVNYYTFTYTLDENAYIFTDSPDREYDIGETFTTHLDPNNPEILVLPSSNLAIAFLFLLFSGASVFLCEGTGFLAKYIPHAFLGWSALILITGIILTNATTCALGCIFLVATLVIWILVQKNSCKITRV